MNEIDSTGSVYVVPSNPAPSPAYPLPPGGQIPNLGLAVGPAAGPGLQPMPDPGRPDPINYTLVGDPYMGGYEPSNPAPAAPNLAGVDGWPPPASSLVPSKRNSLPSAALSALSLKVML